MNLSFSLPLNSIKTISEQLATLVERLSKLDEQNDKRKNKWLIDFPESQKVHLFTTIPIMLSKLSFVSITF
jgi:hypothetical protein